jgi:hypothetical protein
MGKFAFEVKLRAAVQIEADTEQQARDALQCVLETLAPSADFLRGFNDTARDVRITEFSVTEDGAEVAS